jgi:DNA polymerase I
LRLQGFSNATFGRIECHGAINAVARETTLDDRSTFGVYGWRVVHGIVDSVRVTPMDDREQTDLDRSSTTMCPRYANTTSHCIRPPHR